MIPGQPPYAGADDLSLGCTLLLLSAGVVGVVLLYVIFEVIL